MTANFKRRDVLRGAGASALAGISVGWTRGNTDTSVNLGGSQLNFWFTARWAQGLFPFNNLLKHASYWVGLNTSAVFTPDRLSSDGYVIQNLPGDVGAKCFFNIPRQASRPGRYVFKWDGNGTFAVGTSLYRGSLSGSRGGRAVVNVADGMQQLAITRWGSPAPTNMRFCHVDDEAAMDAGQVFSQQLLSRLNEARVGTLRFMDSTGTNTTTVVKWSHRRPLSHFSYSSDYAYCPPGYYAGSTTNRLNDYSVTLAGFSLEDKAAVVVLFNANANTGGAVPTLNISGTGAKPILGGSGYLYGTEWPIANYFGMMIYDATLGGWLNYGGNAAGQYVGGFNTGWPPELCVDLCNTVGTEPWFCIPHLAADNNSDYTTELATYCKNNLNSGLNPWFEPTNEEWNPIFACRAIADAIAIKKGGSAV